MAASKNKKINVQGFNIVLYEDNNRDFISLTDIARHKDSEHTDTIVQNWMRNRNTIELLGFWETIYNSNFKPLEFEGFRKQAGLNSFVMTPKRWIESTNAIGSIEQYGKYQCFAYRTGFGARQTTYPAQQNRHNPNEITN